METVSSYDITHAFQSESTLLILRKVKNIKYQMKNIHSLFQKSDIQIVVKHVYFNFLRLLHVRWKRKGLVVNVLVRKYFSTVICKIYDFEYEKNARSPSIPVYIANEI